MILLVGERANARVRQRAWTPRRWLRLAMRLGAFRSGRGELVLRDRLHLRWHASMNLMPPGDSLDPWDSRLAREIASLIPREPFKILVGRRVQAAFGLKNRDNGETVGSEFLCVPHPSGLSRFWNDDFEVNRVAVRCAAALSDRAQALGSSCCVCGQLTDQRCSGCLREVCLECLGLYSNVALHDSTRHLGVLR